MGWAMDGVDFPYLDPRCHNERDIEVPWGREAILRARGALTLEVGNTLQQHYPRLPPRDIVCRYDELGGRYPVLREDIVTFDMGVRYAAIVAISTLEHVGHDYDEPDDNARAITAVARCMQLLAPGGEFVFTIPCGFHESLQDWLVSRPWAQAALMVRVNVENEWVQRPLAEYSPGGYPGPFGCAGKVLFFRYIRPVLAAE